VAQVTALRLNDQRQRVAVIATGGNMITLGIILLIVGLVVKTLHFLLFIGIVLLVIGAVLAIAGFAGREIGGRKHYY
jgi:uncharacterized membrane protein HdeD (DUF308 family)